MGNVFSDSDESDNENDDVKNQLNNRRNKENDDVKDDGKDDGKDDVKDDGNDDVNDDDDINEDDINDDDINEDDINEDDDINDVVNPNWIPDNLDKDDLEFKNKYDLEFVLHNYFLIENKKHLTNMKMKNYNNDKETEYVKLLIKIHSTIIKGDDLIEDIIEDFPFEYQKKILNDDIIETSGLSVMHRIVDILNFYNKHDYSLEYLSYNVLNHEKVSLDGLSIRFVLKILNEHGICNTKYCNKLFIEPSKEAYIKAKYRNKIKYYKIKQNINDIKHIINQNKPILFGISIYNKELALPKKSDKIMSNNCCIIIGYNDEEKEFIVKSDKIYNVKYEYVLNKKLAKDFWFFDIN